MPIGLAASPPMAVKLRNPRRPPMPEIRIPEGVRPALPKLARLSATTAKKLIAAVRDVEPSADQRRFVRAVQERLPAGTRSSAEEIIEAVLSLAIGRDYVGLPIDEFAMRVASNSALKLTAVAQSSLRSRLGNLLEARPLQVTAKAVSLGYERDNTFIDARIVSDLRPVFTDTVGEGPAAAVIVHHLRVHHFDGTRHETTDFALDSDDLASLRAAVDRAEAKQQTLQQYLSRTKIPYIGTEEVTR